MLVSAEKIRDLRLANGWTQEQFAELCGVSVRTIQRVEKTGVASMETTNALAAVFKEERQALLARDGVATASTEFKLKHVSLVAAISFLLGIGIGVLV